MVTRFSAGRRTSSLPLVIETGKGKAIIRDMKLSDADMLLDHIRSHAREGTKLLIEPGEVPRSASQEREILRIYFGKGRKMIVAVMDGMVVGSADVRIGGMNKTKHAASFGIAVRTGYRGLGIGKAMMEYLMDWAVEHGAKKLWLSVFSTNTEAITFYEALGFKEECRKKGQYIVKGQYVDEVIMSLWVE